MFLPIFVEKNVWMHIDRHWSLIDLMTVWDIISSEVREETNEITKIFFNFHLQTSETLRLRFPSCSTCLCSKRGSSNCKWNCMMLGLKWVLNLPHSNEDAALPVLPSLPLQTLLEALCSLSRSALMYYCWLSWQTFLRSVFTDVFYVQGHVPAIMTKWLLLMLILGGRRGE